MADCPINKIDSNISGLSFAEEVCLKRLPVSGDPDPDFDFDPIWYGLEPNSYSDFGGDIKTVARSPIDPARQNKKGTIVDQDAAGGFNIDITQRNLTRLLQGFFFADIREKPTTQPMNGAVNVLGAVTASDDKVVTGATAVAFNVPGLIALYSGFNVGGNNGLKVLVSGDANDITTVGLVDEATPPATAKIEVVGYEFDTADAAILKTGNVLSLTDANAALDDLGLIPGEWIFIGGDTLANDRFVNNVGFARIKTIAAGAIVFDDTTFAGATEASTGKKIRIFFGSVIKNEKLPSLIKRRSYQLERTLGLGPTDAQAEYLEGAVANELTINIPEADKITADLTFMACDNTQRSGEVDDEIKDGIRVPALGEDAINTTSHVYRLKMHIRDALNSNPAALFGYVTEGNLSINNNVTPDKAVGVLGAFDTTAGNFVVGGSLTAYFSTVEAVRAVRRNADVGFSMIVAAKNAGFIYDIPLLGLGGGRVTVEKDQSIKIPLEPNGAENANGYTLLYNVFPYLPEVAMP